MKRIGSPYTIVSPARACVIRQQFNDDMDQKKQAGQYYTLYCPYGSWKHLSVALYEAGETSAMQLARKYLHTIKGTAVIVTVYCTCCTLIALQYEKGCVSVRISH